MAKKKLRAALIGCGDNMTRSHVPRVLADGAVEVVALADPVRAAAGRVAQALGYQPPWFADWRRLLREVECDAVLISTPHDLHHPQVRAALAAGRHVLAEKPLATSARHARALIEAAEQAGQILAVAYQRHHMAPYAYARELVRRGKIGEVRGLVGYVTQGWLAVGGWRHDRDVAGGGMFMDTGSHLVAAALWVTGLRARRVSASVARNGGPVDVNTVAHVAFDGGAYGTLSTFGEAGRHDERLAVAGSAGSLVLHMHEWRFRSLLVDDQPAAIPARVRDTTPDQAFFDWIRNGGKGYEPAWYAYDAARLTEAVYRSGARHAESRIGP